MIRRPTAPPAEPLPADVRLLQGTAQAVLWLAVLVLLGLALVWAVRQPVFALRSITVQGDITRNNAQTLGALVLPRLQGNFITMDLQRTRAVFQTVPWVRKAVVRRVWPMRLVVQIEEHRAAATWGADEVAARLVNSHGEVFEAELSEADDQRLPLLDGPAGSAPQMLAMARRLEPVLASLGAGELQRLSLSARGSWRVQLDKNVRLELGRGAEEELLARTTKFVDTMPSVLATYQRPLQSADLRHLGGFAVRLRGITTLAPPPPPPAPVPPRKRNPV